MSMNKRVISSAHWRHWISKQKSYSFSLLSLSQSLLSLVLFFSSSYFPFLLLFSFSFPPSPYFRFLAQLLILHSFSVYTSTFLSIKFFFSVSFASLVSSCFVVVCFYTCRLSRHKKNIFIEKFHLSRHFHSMTTFIIIIVVKEDDAVAEAIERCTKCLNLFNFPLVRSEWSHRDRFFAFYLFGVCTDIDSQILLVLSKFLATC